MFYEPALGHPFAIDPFKALVAPRPIGWISTISKAGQVNLAPYSFFNAVCSHPPIIMFSSEGDKHTLTNVKQTGECVCNIVTELFAEKMNITSTPFASDVNEFIPAGLMMIPSSNVLPPRVEGIAAALECRTLSVHRLAAWDGSATRATAVFAQVVGVYIDDKFLKDGRVDTASLKLLARCGYDDYAIVERLLTLSRPLTSK